MEFRHLSLTKSYPELALEWHPKYNKQQFDDFSFASNKKVWWICKTDQRHEWQASISARTTRGTGCPFCSGNKVDHTNCLSKVYPDLAKEWHPTKNNKLNPNNLFCRSTRKVWWKCPQGPDHEWAQSPRQRVKAKIRCLYCDGKKLSVTNSLQAVSPKTAKYWHPTKNGELTPNDVTFKDTKKVWWKCSKGPDHVWETTVANKVLLSECIYCSGNKVSVTNSLGSKFPQVAREWDYKLNYPLTPNNVTSGSSLKVYWRCSFDPTHTWKARINSRTSPTQLNGCQICGARQKSTPELRILAELKNIFGDIQYRRRIDGREIDLFIPSLKIGIEYDGSYYHKNKFEVDSDKNAYFAKKNIGILRLRRAPLNRIAPNDILIKQDELKKADIDALLLSIKGVCAEDQKHTINGYINETEFQNDKVYNEYLAEFPKPIFQRSLAALHPELSLEWHYEKNSPLQPDDFTPGSDRKVYWLCKKNSNHIWLARICHRTNKKTPTRCPMCFGKGPHRNVDFSNSFKTCYPEAASEWHPTKNGDLKLSEISYGSGLIGFWVCSNCGTEWQSSVRKHKRPGCSNHCRNVIKFKSIGEI